jgi:hypothetical protein
VPTIANFDSSFAVIVETLIVRVFASLQHLEPRDVGSTLGTSAIVPVFEIASDEFFSVSAPATGDASSDIADGGAGEISTIAPAFPKRVLSLFADKSQCDQSPEPLTRDISECRQDGLRERLLRLGTIARSAIVPLTLPQERSDGRA